MERFLDEQDNSRPLTPSRERSSSPYHSSLIYGDPKRQQHQQHSSPANNSATPVEISNDIVEMVQKVCPQELQDLLSSQFNVSTSSALPGTASSCPSTTATSSSSSSALAPSSSSNGSCSSIEGCVTVGVLPSFTSAPPATAVRTLSSPPTSPVTLPGSVADTPSLSSQATNRKRPATDQHQQETAENIDTNHHQPVSKKLKNENENKDENTAADDNQENGLEDKGSSGSPATVVGGLLGNTNTVGAVTSDKPAQSAGAVAASLCGPSPSTSPPVAASEGM